MGAGCEMYYFPETYTYVFMAVNLGVLVEGPVVTKVNDLKETVVSILI